MDVSQLLSSYNTDIIGLTETRLSSAFNDNELHIPCFRLFRKDRDEFGGGVAFYVKDCLKVTCCCDFDSVAVESIACMQIWRLLSNRVAAGQIDIDGDTDSHKDVRFV